MTRTSLHSPLEANRASAHDSATFVGWLVAGWFVHSPLTASVATDYVPPRVTRDVPGHRARGRRLEGEGRPCRYVSHRAPPDCWPRSPPCSSSPGHGLPRRSAE